MDPIITQPEFEGNYTDKFVFNIGGNLDLLRRTISNRTVGICLQGASLHILENTIKKFESLDICWAGINRFNVIQDYILNQINKPLEIVLDIADVARADDYDKAVRIPRLETFIKKNEGGVILTKVSILENMLKVSKTVALNPKHSCVFLDTDNCNFCIPNSLTLYLFLLTRYGAKQIVLFGLDGLTQNHTLLTAYYRIESLLKERQIGFGNKHLCYLHLDAALFNTSFLGLYTKYCVEQNVIPLKIWNCNPDSYFTLFPKISHEKIREQLWLN